MKTFTLNLQSASQNEKIENVTSFVSEDNTGRFGILPDHARMIAYLSFGISWFREKNATERYIALPGGVLYFINNQLYLSTSYYLVDQDYHRLTEKLENELKIHEENVRGITDSLKRLDEEIIKYLLRLKK